MSGGHSSSRRRAYGSRQKALRDRPESDLSVDLDGPARWARGSAWDTAGGSGSGQWQLSDGRPRPSPGL